MNIQRPNSFRTGPDERGHFGLYGGRFVAETLMPLILDLETRFPAMRGRLRDDAGELRRFVNLYVNGEDVRFREGLATGLRAGDELSIVPAVAGG